MTIYLYIKQHNVTKLKYFGKTTNNPYTYNGSGKYWKRHIHKHGLDISTLYVYEFSDINECSEFALNFSSINNIVESNEWANMKPENGSDGGDNSYFIDYNKTHSSTKGKTYEEIYGVEKAAELKKQRSLSNIRTKRGVPMSEDQKQKRRHSYGPRSAEFKAKLTEVAKNRPKPIGECPHCGKTGVIRSLKRWHYDNCSIVATL
jgi:ribosomal protein L37AE/L43A